MRSADSTEKASDSYDGVFAIDGKKLKITMQGLESEFEYEVKRDALILRQGAEPIKLNRVTR